MPDNPQRVAIVGAGMAGLACAMALHAAGLEVTLFDKGRRPGGRLATRRAGTLSFDHGASYAIAEGPAFSAFVTGAGERLAAWEPAGDHVRWVGVPGMSAFAVAAGQRGIGTLLTRRHVGFLSHDDAGWHLRHLDAAVTRPGAVIDDGEKAGPFDRIVLALPAPQAAGLLAALGHPFAARVAAVGMDPCWVLMLAFRERQDGPDIRETEPHGPLDWIARDSSRPGRLALPDSWVAHAGADWSRVHLEQEPDRVLASLRAAFTQATGIDATPIHAEVHRWRYARAGSALDQACLWDPAGLALCGDWCLGTQVEAAFDSGCAAAGACI